jgi:hypothetical protein
MFAICGSHSFFEIAPIVSWGSPHGWQMSNVPTDSQNSWGFIISYAYEFITKLLRQQEEFIQKHENERFCDKDKAKFQQRECKGRNLVAVRLVKFQWTQLSIQQNKGQMGIAAVEEVMCAMHIAWTP